MGFIAITERHVIHKETILSMLGTDSVKAALKEIKYEILIGTSSMRIRSDTCFRFGHRFIVSTSNSMTIFTIARFDGQEGDFVTCNYSGNLHKGFVSLLAALAVDIVPRSVRSEFYN